jgi:hypothetical protein
MISQAHNNHVGVHSKVCEAKFCPSEPHSCTDNRFREHYQTIMNAASVAIHGNCAEELRESTIPYLRKYTVVGDKDTGIKVQHQ